MLDLNNLPPEKYRERYESLQAAARARAVAKKPPVTFSDISPDSIFLQDDIPPGWYAAIRLPRGTFLHITNPSGTPGVSAFAWNEDDVSERFNVGDTTKLQWTTNLTTGRVLFSDMGRVMASIITDSGAGHDCLIGPNSPAQTSGRNGRDNLRSAAMKFGLSRRDVSSAISLFSPVAVDKNGILSWRGNPPAGAAIELRAEMNLLVALSNTPHALSPAQEACASISYTAFHGLPSDQADLCRNFTAESARGFSNNARYFSK